MGAPDVQKMDEYRCFNLWHVVRCQDLKYSEDVLGKKDIVFGWMYTIKDIDR